MFEFDKQEASKDDAFHFVAYMPFQGRLYELDGLREGPIDLGKCEQDDWIGTAKQMLDKRILRWGLIPSLHSELASFQQSLLGSISSCTWKCG